MLQDWVNQGSTAPVLHASTLCRHLIPVVSCAQLAYKFAELVEIHASDTYAEFVDANEVLTVTIAYPALETMCLRCTGLQHC